MKPERIEDLLSTQPPDEPPYRGPLVPGPLATTPVRAGRPRASTSALGGLRSAALVVVTIGFVAGAFVVWGGAGPRPTPTPNPSLSPSQSAIGPTSAVGVIPWIDATPAPSPTPEPTPDPASLAVCQPVDLVLVAGGWGGATGSLAGGVELLDVSQNPCHIGGPYAVELLDASGAVIAAGGAGPGSGTDLVALAPGGGVTATMVWSNWCAAPPPMPLHVRLTLPGAAAPLTAEVRERAGGLAVPRCDAPGSASAIGVPTPFAPPEPSSGGYQPEACSPGSLVAFSGRWGFGLGTAYADMVVLNDGSADCAIAATPTLELRDAHDALLASSKPAPDAHVGLTLPLAWTAVGSIAFADWCTAAPTLPLHLDLLIGATPVLVAAQPPVGSEAAIPVPACNSAPLSPAPVFTYNEPLAIPGSPAPPAPDPIDTLPVTVTLSPLPTVAPGADLAYTVTLTNKDAYGKPINLAALCPTYTERLYLPGGASSLDTSLALNCAAAGVLAGSASLTFEMRLPIPSDAPAGTATLVWQLGERGPATKVTFQIGP
jgi:Protein of unknown function (DUF4232)